jgi:hypothetical protein
MASAEGGDGSKGQARLLGDCVLELGPLMPQINDIYGVGVRQQMAFARRRDDKEVVVGRFTCTIKIVVSYFFQPNFFNFSREIT